MTTLVIAFDNSTNFLMILQTNVTKRQIEIILYDVFLVCLLLALI